MISLYEKEEAGMYTIWNIGHPCVISDILKTNPELNRNTVVKVLKTLTSKGYIKVDSIIKTATRTGRGYIPIIQQEDYEEQKQLMSMIVESSTPQDGILQYCSTLANGKHLDAAFIDEMERLFDNLKSKES